MFNVDEPLAGIPEALWDEPVDGVTPREAAAHFVEHHCRGCWGILLELTLKHEKETP